MMSPSKSEPQHQQPQTPSRDRLSVPQSYSQAPPAPLQLLPRSPERPLAQCQVKPMPKAVPSPRESVSCNNEDYFQKKTDYNNHYSKAQLDDNDDFVPIPMDRPSGLAIDDFLPVIIDNTDTICVCAVFNRNLNLSLHHTEKGFYGLSRRCSYA
jgi:hypothetical protein